MPIKAIGFNPFESGKVSQYTPAAIPSETPKTSGNPFSENVGEVTQIGQNKRPYFECGLGGTNDPSGHSVFYAA